MKAAVYGRFGCPDVITVGDHQSIGLGIRDDFVAAAMIDRLVHHTDVVSINGDSYRLKDSDLGRVPAANQTNDKTRSTSKKGVTIRTRGSRLSRR
jgi:hypothetical protein